MKKKLASILAALSLLLGVGLVSAPAANAHGTNGWYYTYHYDNHCAPYGIQYAGEPYRPGYVVKWWYKDYHHVHTYFEKYWFGYIDQHYTVFSHREYTWSRCYGTW